MTDNNMPTTTEKVFSCNSNNLGQPQEVILPQPPAFQTQDDPFASEQERNAWTASLNATIDSAVNWLKKEQTERGYWAGFLKTNSAIEAEWIIAMYFLGITDDPKYDDVVRSILSEQRPDGSWSVYYDSQLGDINATVERFRAIYRWRGKWHSIYG